MKANDVMFVSHENQFPKSYTPRNEDMNLNGEVSYSSYSPSQPVRSHVPRQEPVFYSRSSFVEVSPQKFHSQYSVRPSTVNFEGKVGAARSFPHYLPGQMPFDFLSLPLINFMDGPNGPSISSFRPQLGSLPAPRAPLGFQPFPFQPSWTDSLVEELKRDPSWDKRLSFVSRLPSDLNSDEYRRKVSTGTEPARDKTRTSVHLFSPKLQAAKAEDFSHPIRKSFDDERSAIALAKANEQKVNLPQNIEQGNIREPLTVETHSKSPRVLNPKPIGQQSNDDVEKNAKVVSVAENSHSASGQGSATSIRNQSTAKTTAVGAPVTSVKTTVATGTSGVPAATKSTSVSGSIAGTSGIANGSKVSSSIPKTGAPRKEMPPPGVLPDMPNESGSGGLAARRAAYMQATKIN